MKAPTTFEKFLSAYGAKCEDGLDIALFSLLSAYRDDIKPVFEEDYDRFHKMFRIVDVCSKPEVDNAIWHLMEKSKPIWDLL